MVSFIHIGKNVSASELGWYGDAILDVCCQNIASSDEIWHLVVEMSVILVTCVQRSNPRSSWYTCFSFFILFGFLNAAYKLSMVFVDIARQYLH